MLSRVLLLVLATCVVAGHASSDLDFACPSPTLSLSATSVAAGSSVTATVSNLVPFAEVSCRVVKRGLSPLLTLSTAADKNGVATVTLAIPSNAPAGAYAAGCSSSCGSETLMATGALTITASAAINAENEGEAETEIEDDDTEENLPELVFACPTPTLTLSASTVAAGATISATIKGVVAFAPVTCRVVKRGLSPLITMPGTADKDGMATLILAIPTNAPAGAYAAGCSFDCGSETLMATGSLTITTAVEDDVPDLATNLLGGCPNVAMSISSGKMSPGDVLNVQLTNMPPDAQFFVRISRLTFSPLVSLKGVAEASGSVSLDLLIPATAPANNYTLSARVLCDDQPTTVASQITIIKSSPPLLGTEEEIVAACATPSVQVYPSTATPGDIVTFVVDNLASSGTFRFVVTRQGISPLVFLTGSAAPDGVSRFTQVIPRYAGGDYNVFASVHCSDGSTVTGTSSLHINPVEDDLNIACPAPSMTLENTSVCAGAQLRVFVSNLMPAADFQVRVARRGLSPLLLVKAVGDQAGSAVVTLAIPANAPAFNYTLGVHSSCGDASSSLEVKRCAAADDEIEEDEEEDGEDEEATEVTRENVAAEEVAACGNPTLSCPSSVTQGAVLTVAISELPPSTTFVLSVSKKGLSPLIHLRSQSDDTGSATRVVTVPANTPQGDYNVVVSATCGDSPIHAQAALHIDAAAVASL